MEKSEVEADDGALIAAFVRGDERAFEQLYGRYKRQLYGFLNNLIVDNPAEVDEVFEETWLRVLEKLPRYRDEGRFSAWLFRIGRNIFIDRIRKNRNFSPPAVPNTEAKRSVPDLWLWGTGAFISAECEADCMSLLSRWQNRLPLPPEGLSS